MNKKEISKNEKIEACIMLSSFFDTVGFHNGKWEFKGNIHAFDLNQVNVLVLTLIQQFYVLGGPNHMSIKLLNASDDTILFLATLRTVNKGGGELNYIDEYLKIFNLLIDPSKFRGIGYQTYKSLEHLKKLRKISKSSKKTFMEDLKKEKTMGGNGAAIRTAVIGIKWHNNIDKVIEESIIASRITHNYALGFLGGLVSALFTNYAYNGIKPWLWIDNLLNLYENNNIKNYINSTDLKDIYNDEIDKYFYYWYKYKEKRFDSVITNRLDKNIMNPIENTLFFAQLIEEREKKIKNKEISYNSIASSGADSVIYAYDALLLSIVPEPDFTINLNNPTYSFESLIFFGCIHIGDTDSTGAILGAWYGALNGYTGMGGKERIKDLEFYNELLEESNLLIKSLKL